MPWKSFKTESKRDWGQTVDIGKEICADQVKQGALLRIADAVEVIAQNYAELIQERDKYLRWYHEEETRRRMAETTLSHLRGYITKLKKSK